MVRTGWCLGGVMSERAWQDGVNVAAVQRAAADQDIYWAAEVTRGFSLRGGRKIEVVVTQAGLELTADGEGVHGRVEAVAVHYDGTRRPLGDGSVKRDSQARNRVYIERERDPINRAAVQEWYVAGPLGIEQGFHIDLSSCRERMLIEIATPGLALSQAADHLTLSSESGAAFGYGGLNVTDASGRVLTSTMRIEQGNICLDIEVSNAEWPVTVDPALFAVD
jgi:hypothetical protein